MFLIELLASSGLASTTLVFTRAIKETDPLHLVYGLSPIC
jgi:hypothetical protein